MTFFWFIFSFATVWCIVLAWWDCRCRRLPNWLTFPGWVLFPLMYLLHGGWNACWHSLLGGGIGLLFLLVPYLLKGAGAGDVKMLCAVGCLQGYPSVLPVLFIMSMSGALLAVGMYLWVRMDKARLRHCWKVCTDWKYDRKEGVKNLPPQEKKELSVPYGVAIAAGCWGTFLLQALRNA